jgi:hypothetical protein
LLLIFGLYGGQCNVTLSDNNLNSWSAPSELVGSVFPVWYASNCNAGSTTLTFTADTEGNTLVAGTLRIIYLEITGVEASNPLDSMAVYSGGSSLDVTTANATDLIVAFCAGIITGTGTAITVGPESTLAFTDNVALSSPPIVGSVTVLAEYQTTTAAGTFTSTCVPAVGAQGDVLIVTAFKLS